jgi:hypothetical protein
VNELLAGRGGEEEHSRARSSSTAAGWPYLRCFSCSSRALMLFLSVGRGGESEDSGGAAGKHWRRCHICINLGAECASFSPSFIRRLAWEALQQGTHAGVLALPQHHMAERRPLSRFSSSTGRLSGSSLTTPAPDAPSGLLPGGVGSGRWRCPFSGADQGPDRFFAFFPRVLFVKFDGFSVIWCFSETLYVIWPVTAWN